MITEDYLKLLEQEMLQAAEDLEFERAASLRDKLMHLKEHIGEQVAESGEKYNAKGSGRKGRGAKSGSRIPGLRSGRWFFTGMARLGVHSRTRT